MEVMLRRGLKQNVLAKKAGMSQSLVSEILNGKRPNVSLDTIPALKHEYICRADTGFGGTAK